MHDKLKISCNLNDYAMVYEVHQKKSSLLLKARKKYRGFLFFQKSIL